MRDFAQATITWGPVVGLMTLWLRCVIKERSKCLTSKLANAWYTNVFLVIFAVIAWAVFVGFIFYHLPN